ncbi:MAG: lipocalin-like domain-containing protein [Syntrophobacteraceae bacterium]
MAENPFIGTWRLVSFELRSENGQVSYPFGQDVDGYIIYSQDGYMSVAFMKAGRSNFTSRYLFADGSMEEKALAVDTYMSYCGKYEVCGDKVIHHIEVSLFPNWTGKDQQRFYRFDGDRLILSSPPVLREGIEQTAHLTWKRSRMVG